MRKVKEWWYTFTRGCYGAVCHKCGDGLVFSFCHMCAAADIRRERAALLAHENATRVPKSLYKGTAS